MRGAARQAVLPCDFCGDPVAPFGFAPPPRLGIPVRRPIKTCGGQACKDQAAERLAALVAKRDPLAGKRRRPSSDPAVSRQPQLI